MYRVVNGMKHSLELGLMLIPFMSICSRVPFYSEKSIYSTVSVTPLYPSRNMYSWGIGFLNLIWATKSFENIDLSPYRYVCLYICTYVCIYVHIYVQVHVNLWRLSLGFFSEWTFYDMYNIDMFTFLVPYWL